MHLVKKVNYTNKTVANSVLNMSSFIHGYPFLFIVFSTAFLLSRIHTLPIPDNPYDKFIEFLTKNNCTMPEEVELQFPTSSDPSAPFSYLSSPLTECQSTDALEEINEAKFMCKEIFDVLQNITCLQYNTTLPKIKSKPLSENICNDFKSMQDILPKNDYLSGKLVDDTVCKLLCTEAKYALLCKMLLWSHDIQAKIESALENDAKDNEKENIHKNTASMGATIKVSLAQDEINSIEKEINNKIADEKISADSHAEDKKKSGGASLKNLDSLNTSTLSTLGQTTSGKINSSTINRQNGLDMKTSIIPENPEMSVSPKNESEADNQKVDVLQLDNSNQNPSPTVNNDQNKIKYNINDGKVEKNIPVGDVTDAASLTSEVNIVKETRKNNSLINFQNKGNNATVSNTSTETNGNADNFVSQNPGMDNNLHNVNIEGENEKKVTQTNLKKDEDDEKVEKPKLTDFEIPIRGSPDIDLKQIESTTLQILPDNDKNIEHQEDKDQEQYPEEYNENENEGDYPKPEYENSFSPHMKNREPIDKSSVKEGSNQMLNSYDPFLSSRNGIRHGHDNIPVIPSFPEQEDSHFFFYFLSIVLILMAGYLIFHNKQKIIALIVEGRHERRRRSHGAGYKKLETK